MEFNVNQVVNVVEAENGGVAEEIILLPSLDPVPSPVLAPPQHYPIISMISARPPPPTQQVIIIENTTILAENARLKEAGEEKDQQIQDHLATIFSQGNKIRELEEAKKKAEGEHATDLTEMKKLVAREIKLKEEAKEELNKLKESIEKGPHFQQQLKVPEVEQRGQLVPVQKTPSTMKMIRGVNRLSEKVKFQCWLCKRLFPGYFLVRKHQRDYHNITRPVKEYGCGYCGKLFLNCSELHKHRRFAHPLVSRRPKTKNRPGFRNVTKGGIKIVGVRSLTQDPVAHCSKSTPPGPTWSPKKNTGERHGLSFVRRHEGFYCLCGARFLTRVEFQGHLRFWKRTAVGSKGRPLYPVQNEEMKPLTSDSSGHQQEVVPFPSGSPLKYGVDVFKALEGHFCLCGLKCPSERVLLRHVKSETALKTAHVTSQVASCRSVKRVQEASRVSNASIFVAGHEAQKTSEGMPACSCGKIYLTQKDVQTHIRLRDIINNLRNHF